MIDSELIILCGGRGKRLRPTTETIPKALVSVRGRPIIDHVAERYQQDGIDNVTLCVGYKGEQIEQHFASAKGMSFQISDSGENAGMLRRIHDAALMVQKRRFIVAYCDTFIDYSVLDLLVQHKKNDALATVITASVKNPFGILQVNDDNKIESFVEKPQQTYFIGTFVVEKRAMDLVTYEMLQMPDGDGLVSFFQTLIGIKQLAAYHHKGMRITFNTENERVVAEAELDRFYTLVERRSN